MAVNMTSKIILAKDIRLDRAHENVVDISVNDMLGVMNSNTHYVASANDFSFIRATGTLKADINYDSALIANYLAFQNPSYSNKWFFAFIDRIEYKGENCIEIFYTVDNWMTWFKDLTLLPVLVEREHTNDDTFGNNNLAEPVTSNNIIVSHNDRVDFSTYNVIVFFVPSVGFSAADLPFDVDDKYLSPVRAYRYPGDISGVTDLVTDLADPSVMGGGDVMAMFMYPQNLIDPTIVNNNRKWMSGSISMVDIDKDTVQITTLNGYTPKNQKMFTYPYCWCEVDNGSNSVKYEYEFFAQPAGSNPNRKQGHFKISGAPLPDGGITVYPTGYLGSGSGNKNPYYAISICDMPQIAYPMDTYAAWLAQKGSIAIPQGLIAAFSGMTGGAKGGGAGAGAGAVTGALGFALNYQNESFQAEAASDSLKGYASASLDMIGGIQGFNFKHMSLKYDEAKRIDHFFSMFGYNTGLVKIPNITGRTYWNYIKINGVLGHGPIPAGAMEDINNIANKGVTIWHSHDNVGNYTIGDSDLANPIVTP